MPMFAPADIDNAPLEALSNDTLLRALEEALNVSVNDPAPLALARDMLFPPTNASETAVPVTDVPPPLRDCVPAAPPVAPDNVIELPLAVPDRPPVSEIWIVLP